MADPMEGLNQPGPIDKDGYRVLGPSNQQSVRVDPAQQEEFDRMAREKELREKMEAEAKDKKESEEDENKLNLDNNNNNNQNTGNAGNTNNQAQAQANANANANANVKQLIPEEIAKINEDFKDLTDGKCGCFKKILQEGSGNCPPMESRVKCHYTGTLTLDGMKFDSSLDRNDPFKFKIGRGEVIKGWDIGIGSMKIGEKAILRCSPDYAYGERATGNIPPNSWLDFSVELLDYSEFLDIDDGRVSKKQLRRGKDSAFDKPKEDAKCVVSYVGKYLKDGKSLHNANNNDNKDNNDDFIIFMEGKNVEFLLEDDDNYCQGFHIAVKDMIKEELSFFKIESTVGYGEKGDKKLGVPPNKDIYYEIELHKFENEKEQWQMTNDEFMAKGEKLKQQGNESFKEGNLIRAKRKYDRAINIFEDDRWESDQKIHANNMLTSVKNNLSLIALKNYDYNEVILKASEVLEMNNSNAKALARRGQAYLRLGDFDNAKYDLTKALKLMPKDPVVTKLLKQCKSKIKEYKEKERNLFKDAFKSKKKKSSKKKKVTSEEKKDESENVVSANDVSSTKDDCCTVTNDDCCTANEDCCAVNQDPKE